jgi:Flp pilus assembly protein TadG
LSHKIHRLPSVAKPDQRQGAAAIEFAFIAPVFLLLLSGIIEFGQAFQVKHTLSEASRRGARAAIIDGTTNSQITSTIKTFCTATLKASSHDVTVTISVNGDQSKNISSARTGDEINVRVAVSYSKVGTGFYSSMLSNAVLSSSCALEHE